MIELSNQEQVALCSLRHDEWRGSKFFVPLMNRLTEVDLAERRDNDGRPEWRLTPPGHSLAVQLRDRRHRRMSP